MSYATQTLFMAIDKPLSSAQREAAESLSSRAVVTDRAARYIYHFGGGFRGNFQDMLTSGGFDAALWEDSADSIKLAFSIPEELFPWSDFLPYFPQEEYPAIDIEAPLIDGRRLLTLSFNNEDGDGRWLEENMGSLSELLPLRAALMNGDYRCLFLAWAANRSALESREAMTPEELLAYPVPTVPPALSESSPELIAFCERFYVYEDDYNAYLPQSGTMNEVDYAPLLERLTTEDKDAWLLRLARAEGLLGAQFRRVLER
ncbi:MAG: hypothetical protein AAFZ52_00630 [Bacteroidota bacterium]